jgi:hypothetical protein
MRFDEEGHVVVTPREWQDAIANPDQLVNDVWLPGTPWAFPTYGGYRRFWTFLSERLGVHPNNIIVRGSTKIGFSAPRPDLVWYLVF